MHPSLIFSFLNEKIRILKYLSQEMLHSSLLDGAGNSTLLTLKLSFWILNSLFVAVDKKKQIAKFTIGYF